MSQSLKALLGLRDLVYSGGVAPGERLSEVALSERLGLSRTPLRAALARLEQEGLLEQIPSGGFAVRSFTREEVIDAIELRGVLEGTAARLAAERGVPPARMVAIRNVVAELDAIVAVPVDAMDFDAYVARNASFHDMLTGLCGSAILRREIERSVALPFAGPSAFLNAQTDIPAFRKSLVIGQGHHRAIVEAIELREGARAEAVAREHARLARANLIFVSGDRDLMARVPGLALMTD
ncbi:MAG: GntR family transcriptional regulator [Rhizobiaceae bacterium]|nr:GntR family transcriptional regulator [Rhizobiaceae bacterium]MCV0405133.1 GntR family transcriptional regulator [Rhizobiaceae bacterium]